MASNELKPIEAIDPLHYISGAAYDMELPIRDAIGIARTVHRRSMGDDDAGEYCSATMGLLLYLLEQIQEGHEVIVKNAPYSRYVPGEKERLS